MEKTGSSPCNEDFAHPAQPGLSHQGPPCECHTGYPKGLLWQIQGKRFPLKNRPLFSWNPDIDDGKGDQKKISGVFPPATYAG